MENLYKAHFKRVFDIIFSFLGIVVLAPIMIIVVILVRVFLGSPVIFKQQRPGLNGKIFTICKFRTMKDTYNVDGKLTDDDLRVTKFGLFLRNWSLDEFPELFNVLKGEMSLVGPRPLLVEYLDRYNNEQIKRHSVKPGITGWAQVNGRNNITWEKKFAMDLWYVKRKSFLLDIKILFLTIKKILLREDINQEGYVSMEKFDGVMNDDVKL